MRSWRGRGICSMAEYGVELPIAGWIYLEVEAESEEDAIEKALIIPWDDDDVQELCTYRELVAGHVVRVPRYKTFARKIE